MMKFNKKYFHFYSVISFMLHLLYFIGLIGNTFPIALFVCIVSQIFLFVHPGYINKIKINWFYEFLFHWLPIILIKYDLSNMNYLYSSSLFYIVIMNKKIIIIYNDPLKYLQD